ncbi:MAG: flavin reductase family protein [Candidatus Methanomethylophilaceae archaeon]|nr:flavin reductase family protein [Candidatus Methanomethylophilaceae archaeon]
MRKDFGSRPWVYPMPVFIVASYCGDGTPDAMTAAWGGIAEEDRISICMDTAHKTAENIRERRAFTVSIGTEKYVSECDYVGIVSANDVPDKFARSGFHAVRSGFVDAPLIEELPLALECELISFDESTCTLLGRIVNVSADESILTDGRIDARKLGPIVYDTVGKSYYAFGNKAGSAFSDGKKLCRRRN